MFSKHATWYHCFWFIGDATQHEKHGASDDASEDACGKGLRSAASCCSNDSTFERNARCASTDGVGVACLGDWWITVLASRMMGVNGKKEGSLTGAGASGITTSSRTISSAKGVRFTVYSAARTVTNLSRTSSASVAMGCLSFAPRWLSTTRLTYFLLGVITMSSLNSEPHSETRRTCRLHSSSPVWMNALVSGGMTPHASKESREDRRV